MKRTVLFFLFFIGAMTFTSKMYADEPLAKNRSKFLGNIIQAYSTGSMPANFKTYWNQVTAENGGKWGVVQGNITSTNYNWTQADLAYNYAKTNGFPYKYHTFVWGSQEPNGLTGVSAEVQKANLEAYMEAVAARYPDIDLIDVVNEPLHAPSKMKEAIGGAGETGYDWIVWAFAKARELFPNSKLLINEYGVIGNPSYTRQYLDIVDTLKVRNLIDGIGIQCHYFNLDGTSVSTMNTVLDLLGTSGLPVYISELDIQGGQTEAGQADVYKQKFPVLWEHPAVAGITLWGYIQGRTWRDDTGIVSSPDLTATEKPAMVWLKEYMASAASDVPNQFAGIWGPSSKPATVSVFPNPATDFVKIDADNVSQVDVYDISGNFMMSKKDESTIDITHLEAGIYLFKIKIGNQTANAKVIKR
jgi:Beta-1,4-xylanase